LNLSSSEVMSLAYLIALFLALSGWLFITFFREPNKTTQSFFSWVLLFFGIASAYGLWSKYESKNLLEASLTQLNDNTFQILKANDGHFYTDLLINQKLVDFLIDTGASTTTLTADDAKKVGISVSRLQFSKPIQTANGIAMFANHSVESVKWLNQELGPRVLSISNNGLNQSLLGMDIIKNFDHFSISGDKMFITSHSSN